MEKIAEWKNLTRYKKKKKKKNGKLAKPNRQMDSN